MALNNLPLNDAGGDYYARQFGNRIQNIRKYGATPPTQRKAGCLGSGGAVGGGIFAVIVLIRIIAAVAWIGSSNSDSNYNTYDPPNITIPDPPPPIDWQNNVQVDPPMDPNCAEWQSAVVAAGSAHHPAASRPAARAAGRSANTAGPARRHRAGPAAGGPGPESAGDSGRRQAGRRRQVINERTTFADRGAPVPQCITISGL